MVYGLEVVLPINFQIPSLKLVVELLPNTSAEEERFVYLTNLDESSRDVSLANEAHKNRVKAQYDKFVQPRVFNEGDIVLTYDQRHDKLWKGKLKSMWYDPFIVSKVLEKGAYDLVYYDGIPTRKTHNGLYMNRYYA